MDDSTAYFFNIPWSLHAIGAISNSSLDNHHKYQLNYFGNHTIYYAKIRPVTKTIALDSIWDVNADAPLFAWGRSGGINEPSGWNMSQENFQTGWSRVTDCTGGNLLNEGIFHSQSTTFTVKTAQYDVWGYDTISRAYTAYLGHCPPDSLMGVNFSVFGRKNLAHNSVNSTADGNSSSILEVNPSVDHIEIKYFTEKGIEHPKFEIFDLLGRHITSTIQGEHASQGWNTYKLNNLSLPSGSYICRVSGSSFNQSKSFHIVR